MVYLHLCLHTPGNKREFDASLSLYFCYVCVG
jgi:hypothetical protein